MLSSLSSDSSFDLIKLGFWAFFVFGLVSVLVSTLIRIRRFRASRDWPTLSGKITTHDVKLTSMERTGAYDAIVTYEYMVEGVSHGGNQRLRSFSKREEAEKFLRDYLPEGASVLIHYNPDKPSISMLAFNPYDPEGKGSGINISVEVRK